MPSKPTMQDEPKVVRGKGGRFIAARCPDPNCGGVLVEENGDWRCNGLTHKGDHDNLGNYIFDSPINPG